MGTHKVGADGRGLKPTVVLRVVDKQPFSVLQFVSLNFGYIASGI